MIAHLFYILFLLISQPSVNSAYEALRNLIPTEPMNRKLSKIEIIRLASSYITHLSSTLETGTFETSINNNNKFILFILIFIKI